MDAQTKIALEMVAYSSVEGSPIDPDEIVPYAALYETYGTLINLAKEEIENNE